MASERFKSNAPIDLREIELKDIDARDKDGRQDRNGIQELADSMREGLIQPIVVRAKGRRFEIVAGRRRVAAAELLEWSHILAVVMDLSDKGAAAATIIENDQRADAHPLDQAARYHALQKLSGESTAGVAQMVGRTEQYVYDRMRLADLIPAAAQLFRGGKITLGHAIVIARQPEKKQAEIVEPPAPERADKHPLFRRELGLFDDEKDPLAGLTVRTVGELQDWINDHVRLSRKAPDLPQLFAATAANLTAADERKETVVEITRSYHVPPGAKDPSGKRTIGPQSWKRADGATAYDPMVGKSVRSRECEHSVVGFFAVGDGRGETMRVCVDKVNCRVHWPAKKKPAKGSGTSSASAKREAAAEQRRQAQDARDTAARDRWKKSLPAILEAVAKACTKEPAGSKSLLGRYLIAGHARDRSVAKVLSPGTDAASLVRYLAFVDLADAASDYYAFKEFPAVAKQLKVDVAKILDRVAPVKPADKKDSKPAADD